MLTTVTRQRKILFSDRKYKPFLKRERCVQTSGLDEFFLLFPVFLVKLMLVYKIFCANNFESDLHSIINDINNIIPFYLFLFLGNFLFHD